MIGWSLEEMDMVLIRCLKGEEGRVIYVDLGSFFKLIMGILMGVLG